MPIHSNAVLEPISTDFFVGKDSFDDLVIEPTGEDGFHYFKNTKKTLVKRFVLKKTSLSQKHCVVTLIKDAEGAFTPRFKFETLDQSKKAIAETLEPVTAGEMRLIKARVDLNDCHEALAEMLNFISGVENVDFTTATYAVVAADEKAQLSKLMKAVGKEAAVIEFAEKYASEISEADLNLIAGRKKSLEIFRKLLTDPAFFAKCRTNKFLKRDEDLWQHFFEKSPWIFGYGLQLVSCESLDEQKLETIVVGSDIIDGGGKRTDALLKTRGRVSSVLFGEIKIHSTALMADYPRPSVFVPSKDLQGAIGQVQKTIHKVNLKLATNFKKIADKDGNPTGEELSFIRPKGIVIVGQLSEFETPKGLNEEQYASFELYRQALMGIEVITFDELYERARYIVEK